MHWSDLSIASKLQQRAVTLPSQWLEGNWPRYKAIYNNLNSKMGEKTNLFLTFQGLSLEQERRGPSWTLPWKIIQKFTASHVRDGDRSQTAAPAMTDTEGVLRASCPTCRGRQSCRLESGREGQDHSTSTARAGRSGQEAVPRHSAGQHTVSSAAGPLLGNPSPADSRTGPENGLKVVRGGGVERRR